MSESVPLCDGCELRRVPDLEEQTAIDLRARAAFHQYEGDVTTAPSDIPRLLMDEFAHKGINEEAAYAAAECLGKVYRRNCPTADIGFIKTNELGIVRR